ncbi:serine hydrolase domain-containing protein [Nafulsella turpanensis]|uniref:serine hydrolase domain-containing protein n=1 Tax=Nafulsella turpanensis TaxID=1265690 RepID=UPI00034D0E93|nr:serine hydrolase [Nafulsella turpanensis]
MKKGLKISLLALLLLLVIYAVLPSYLRNALTYYHANIDDYTIFENRKVPNSSVHPWPLSRAYNTTPLADTLQEAIETLDPVAFLLVKDGEIVHEQYWDGYGNQSYSNSFSMAKSIVGLLTGIALEEGYIKSLDEPVGNYLPAYQQGDNSQLTIRHLLTMSSGLNWDESYGSPFSVTTKAYYGSDLPELVNELQVIEAPGKEWKYLSGNTQLLALVLEKATHRRLSEYASEKLWKPLGASSPALWSLDKPDGTEKAYCCFNSNARDFARLGQLVLNKGKWKGQQLISPAYLEEALKPAAHLVDEEGAPVDFYGYQWWVVNYKGKAIPYARGILGQYIFVLPDKESVLVRLGHERDSEYIQHHPKDVYLYLDAAYSLLP